MTEQTSNGVAKPNGVSAVPSRDALLAEISTLKDSAAPPPAPKKAVAPEEPKAPETETPPTEEPKPESPEESKEPESEPKAEPEKADDKIDPDTQKGIDKVRREEKRAKEALATERADWKREREKHEASLAPRLAELEKFEAMKARARIDAGSVLEALGLTDADMEDAARSAYARSVKAKTDPKAKAAHDAVVKEREATERLAALEKKLAERDEADKKREQTEYQSRMLNNYLDGVAKAVTDDSPLTKAHLAKNPEAARRALHQAAVDITDPDEPDKAPDFADVVKAYEKKRQQELEDLGVDWRAAQKQSTPATKPSKTLGAGASATVPKKQTRDPKEIDAEIRQQLLDDRLD